MPSRFGVSVRLNAEFIVLMSTSPVVFGVSPSKLNDAPPV